MVAIIFPFKVMRNLPDKFVHRLIPIQVIILVLYQESSHSTHNG